ncbi:MAG: hypothetical protein IPL50_15095 [Chitinophagaceae bacterium]|nr:hypothetical protein [Chitinophagaceae bacterium]
MVIFVTLVVQGLSLPLLIRWLKIKPQDNTDEEEKELQLYLASSTLHFMEKEFPVPDDHRLQEQFIKQYEQHIRKLTNEIQLHKRARYFNTEVKPAIPDNLLNIKLDISKFQRELLVKLTKTGGFQRFGHQADRKGNGY